MKDLSLIRKERLIYQAMAHFDYERMLKVMKCLDWKWALTDEIDRWEIQDTIYELMNRAFEGIEKEKTDNYVVSSGGLEVNVWYDKGKYYTNVKFVVTECESDE